MKELYISPEIKLMSFVAAENLAYDDLDEAGAVSTTKVVIPHDDDVDVTLN